MKQCTKCGEWKDTSEFWKDNRLKSGLRAECITCTQKIQKSYRKSDYGKSVIRQWWKSETGQKALRKYNHTDKKKEQIQKYNTSEHGKEVRKQNSTTYRDRHPLHTKAHNAVRKAKNQGLIPAASTLACAKCGGSAKEYHHHKGYDKEHWLDVIPFCTACHAKQHWD